MIDQVAMDFAKVAGACNWLTQYSYMNIQVFLGFTNFYHRFIHSFLDIAYF